MTEPDKDPRGIVLQLRTAVLDLMERRGATHEWLAIEMGVTRAYVSNMLNGRKQLTLTFVAHALAVLCGDLEVVADDEGFEWSRTPDLGRRA